jgi:serine/threonine-protein kinase 24/25/MST4
MFGVQSVDALWMKPGVFREEYIAIIARELLHDLDYRHMEGKLHWDSKGDFYFATTRSIV